MRVVVVGMGYLGVTAAVGLAIDGHDVIGVECDPDRLDSLGRKELPFFEPDLDVALAAVVGEGRLTFSADLVQDAAETADVIIIAVGSPPLADGGADVTQVEQVLSQVGTMAPAALIVVKSSVPPGTSDAWVASGRFPGLAQRYAYVPEFLSQGSAMRDWKYPDRIVLGGWDEAVVGRVRDLFAADTTYVITTPAEAETIKYASNSFLAMRISFANEIAGLCDEIGGDIDRVLRGVGLDSRIGGSFWKPGIGYGDSCLPKDVAALIHRAATYGHSMRVLEAVQATNQAQHLRPLAILRQERSRLPSWPPSITVLGLVYEPHSDDVRGVPSRSLIPQLRLISPRITVWDPLLSQSAVAQLFPFARHAGSTTEAVRDAEVVVVLTEHPEVVRGDWLGQLRAGGGPVLVIDAKNCLPAALLEHESMVYRAIGRQPFAWPRGE